MKTAALKRPVFSFIRTLTLYKPASVSLTFLFEREPLVTPEHHDEHRRLHQLEGPVDKWEQKQRPDHLWGKGHLQNGDAQLDVLTACFHGDGPPLPEGETYS